VSPETAPRYRFGPRDRRGLVLGLRTGQVVALAVAGAVAVGLVRSVRGGLGVALALVALGIIAAVCGIPVRGRSIDEWLPTASRFVADVALRRKTSVVREHPSVGAPAGPGPFSLLEVTDVESEEIRGAFGAVHDRRRGTWTAVLSLGTEQFALLAEEERIRRVAAWAGVLAAVAGHAGGIHRLQWIERTLPDRGERFQLHLDEFGVAAGDETDSAPSARRSYASLLNTEASASLRHELFLACTVRANGDARAILAAEVAHLDERCRAAALPVDGVLSSGGISSLIRRSFDASPSAAPASWPWPMALDASWSSVRTDATVHATYWIAEWPRTDVSSDFLLPLIVGSGERRTITVTMSPIPPVRAQRRAEHARTSSSADAELRRRHGITTSARRAREFDAVARRENELAEGHAAFRFSGYVTVTSTGTGELERSCARIEQAAALSRVELRRLFGAQAEALAYGLPIGRGCA